MKSGLDALFRPGHVAVIGASRTPGKLGHSVLKNLVAGGYAGRVSAINPAGAEVEGKPGYRSLAELPEPADCAFLAIPAAAIPDAVRECAEAGVRVAVLGASGFAELGTPEAKERQAAIAETARASGLRLVGPNTNGVLSTLDRLYLGYNAAHGERLAPGNVSVVSHSGALMDGIVRRLYRAGGALSKFVAAGNEADLDLLDYLEYLIGDESTAVIALVIEALSDGPRFRQLALQARAADKRVAALKIGRSSAGAQATAAHSSRLAGSARAYEALFREAGVASVSTVEGLAGGCALLASKRDFTDQRLVCVTTSGAGGAILADFAGERGMPLALPMPPGIANPVDMGVVGGDWSGLRQIFETLERTAIKGPTIAYAHSAAAPGWDQNLADALIERNRRCAAPVLALAPGGLPAGIEARYRQGGVAMYHDTAACFDSLNCWYRAAAGIDVAPLPEPSGKATLVALAGARGRFLDEAESSEVLRHAGVPMVESVKVLSREEAIDAAAALDYPVALKALAPGVAHKSREGLVALGIEDPASLDGEFRTMESRLGGKEVPFLVQPMVSAKAELIVGVSREAPLGHFLVFGLGGVLAEALDRVTLVPIPVSGTALRARIAASPLGCLAPLEELARVLEALQDLVLGHAELIDSIDVNPLLVTGRGCVAVDALIVLKPQEGEKT
jgi:acyl-CoA synthetase (NDP forming)